MGASVGYQFCCTGGGSVARLASRPSAEDDDGERLEVAGHVSAAGSRQSPQASREEVIDSLPRSQEPVVVEDSVVRRSELEASQTQSPPSTGGKGVSGVTLLNSFSQACAALLGPKHIAALFGGFGQALLAIFVERKSLAPAVEGLLFDSTGNSGQTWLQIFCCALGDRSGATVESGCEEAAEARTLQNRLAKQSGNVSSPGDLFAAAVFTNSGQEAAYLDIHALLPSDPIIVSRVVALAFTTNRALSKKEMAAQGGIPSTEFADSVRRHMPHFNSFLEKIFQMGHASLEVWPATGSSNKVPVARIRCSAPLDMRRLRKEYPETADLFQKLGHLKIEILDDSESLCAATVHLSATKEAEVCMSMCGEDYVWTHVNTEGELALDSQGSPRQVPFDPGGDGRFIWRVSSSLNFWFLGCAKLQLPELLLEYTYAGRLMSPQTSNWRELEVLGSAEYATNLSWRIVRVGKLPGFTMLAKPVLDVDRLLTQLVESFKMRVETCPDSAAAVADPEEDTEKASDSTGKRWGFSFSVSMNLPRGGTVAHGCTFCLRRFVRKQVQASDTIKFWSDAFVSFGRDLAASRAN